MKGGLCMNNKIYEIVRDNVLEMLDNCGRWLKPWESNVKFAKPYFSDIDEYYQGINILLNRATEYITFKKIQELNEAEAEAVRIIFEKYAYTDMGSLAIAKYLATQGIKKIPRQNGKNELFSETFVRAILDNPVYVGKIAFGRRKTEKIKGSDLKHVVKQSEFDIFDGEHEAIIDDKLWEIVRKKRIEQIGKYERKSPTDRVHILTGLIKCPICGSGLYGNKSVKKKDGKNYKDYFYYGCKHRRMQSGHKCTFNKQIHEDKLNEAVAEVIAKLVKNPEFAKAIKEKINSQIDLTEINTELANLEKMYKRTVAVKDRKRNLESEQLSAERIYKILVYFDKVYATMEDKDKQRFFKALVKEIQIYEDL